MKNGILIIEETLKTDPVMLRKALTDAGQMQQWYFPIENFRAEPGLSLRFWPVRRSETFYLTEDGGTLLTIETGPMSIKDNRYMSPLRDTAPKSILEMAEQPAGRDDNEK